jgi:hypothetical protein
MSDSFAYRMTTANAVEKLVLTQLIEAGWSAFPFGQGLMPIAVRDALRKARDEEGRPCLMRWFPDLVAFKTLTSPLWFDVKQDTGKLNYAIENSALEAAEIFYKHLRAPVWFIWPGLSVLTPAVVRTFGRCWTGEPPAHGSGTPFTLIEKSFAKPLSECVAGETWRTLGDAAEKILATLEIDKFARETLK